MVSAFHLNFRRLDGTLPMRLISILVQRPHEYDFDCCIPNASVHIRGSQSPMDSTKIGGRKLEFKYGSRVSGSI